MLCIIFSNCTHRHFKEADCYEEAPPITVSLDLKIILNSEYHLTENGLPYKRGHQKSHSRRILIEARQKENIAARKTLISNLPTTSNDTLLVSTDLKLQTSRYELCVWMDNTGDNTYPHYTAQSLDNITCSEPYCGNTDTKECLYGNTTIDLTDHPGEIQTHLETTIELFPPLARYEIITTDAKEFLRQISRQKERDYYLTFSYQYFFPMVFDAYTGKVTDSWSNVSFSVPLDIKDKHQTECLLGFDYILADTLSNTMLLNLTVKDAYDNTVANTTNLKIPYKRGCVTRISGRFLTPPKPGKIEINTEFDDDINIELDKLTN